MWWLLLLALAAAGRTNSRSSVVNDNSRPSEIPSRTLTYRSCDGRAYFRFQFTPYGGDIRIHILEFPNRSIGSCHVLQDRRGPYVCWSSSIPSISAAKAVAAMWAEATVVYQQTGKTF